MILAGSFSLLSAQEGRFGYLDFNSTLKLMPEYLEAEINLQKTQSDYREEIERSKREFERKYIEFMLEQDHLSASIVAKRQKELQLLMDNNAEFRDKVQTDLENKREELLIPLKKKLMDGVDDIVASNDNIRHFFFRLGIIGFDIPYAGIRKRFIPPLHFCYSPVQC